ncbi:DUF7674 family protein [Erythrobacter sp. HA6-11]
MNEPKSITRAEFFDDMIEACPTFQGAWLRFNDEWKDNSILFEDRGDGTLPHYLLLSELANHLIEMLERGDTIRFPAIFEVIEDWVVCGEHYVSEAAVVGLLEDLTAIHRYSTAHPSMFIPWLGPESKKWWSEVIDFWKRLDSGNFRPLSID